MWSYPEVSCSPPAQTWEQINIFRVKEKWLFQVKHYFATKSADHATWAEASQEGSNKDSFHETGTTEELFKNF